MTASVGPSEFLALPTERRQANLTEVGQIADFAYDHAVPIVFATCAQWRPWINTKRERLLYARQRSPISGHSGSRVAIVSRENRATRERCFRGWRISDRG